MGKNKFTCLLQTTVVMKDAEADFERMVELPFVPVEGMRISSAGKYGSLDFYVDDVTYFLEDDEFLLQEIREQTNDGCCCEPGEGCCGIDVFLEWFTERGWTVTSIRRGYERLETFPWIFDPEKWSGAVDERNSDRKNPGGGTVT